MTIIPTFRREMVAAARQGRLQSERQAFAGLLFVMVVGTFAAWYYWSGGELTPTTLGQIANTWLIGGLAVQFAPMGTILIRGATAIACERERRTLDFLLATRLSAAEVVLGKLAACVAISLGSQAAGLPVMLLLHVVGGVELRVIYLGYAAFASMILFLSSLAIWISAESPDRRTAMPAFFLCLMAWLIGPFSLSIFLPRMGIRMPDWLASANWSLVSCSPMSLFLPLATGLRSWPQLVDLVGRMMVYQLAGTAFFTLLAIVRLRPVNRALAGEDRKSRRRRARKLVWRLRRRPPVGDDPILWREMYTSRESALVKGLGLLIFGGLTLGLAAGTFYFARPAFVELWRNGYRIPSPSAIGMDGDILVRLFIRGGPGGPVDAARHDFNVFLRVATLVISIILSFQVGGTASEALGVERMKQTWTSLLATPMTAAEFVRSAIRSAAGRTRGGYVCLLVLWTLGLAAGALHPLGCIVAILELAASSWLMAVLGVLGSIQARKAEAAPGQGLGAIMILTFTGLLPTLLPLGLNSVFWGVGSLPFVLWVTLMSPREAAVALAAPLNPGTPRFGLIGGEMPIVLFACWAVAIVGPSLGGWWAWRYAVRHFDRLVGRPIRPAASAARRERVALPVA